MLQKARRVKVRSETLLFYLRALICGASRVSHQNTRKQRKALFRRQQKLLTLPNSQSKRQEREGGAGSDNREGEI